ncbi:LysO family transporter [Tepidibacter mesophilus]|uniref:LysO family transporter n=1 Tax=Tepidibacter mesophilus TaxID=655607 RepID=UPI000C07844B|nr:LysO family transporter [Tepidibacter mesophilus]
MKILILSLLIGILLGSFKIIPNKYLKLNSKFQLFALILLLFSMGISIGSNKDMFNSINTLGLQAISFSTMTIIFSTLVLYLITNLFFNTKESQKEDTKE